MPTLTLIPSSATLVRTQPRVLKASFGNGYEQRVRDGINSMPLTWELEWTNHPLTNGQILRALFESAGGADLITWTPPVPYAADGAKTYVCEDWALTYLGGSVCSFHATLLQRPNV